MNQWRALHDRLEVPIEKQKLVGKWQESAQVDQMVHAWCNIQMKLKYQLTWNAFNEKT